MLTVSDFFSLFSFFLSNAAAAIKLPDLKLQLEARRFAVRFGRWADGRRSISWKMYLLLLVWAFRVSV